MHASVTRGPIMPGKADDVRSSLREQAAAEFRKHQQNVEYFIGLISDDEQRAIGITIYSDQGKMREVEGKPGAAHGAGLRDLKDPQRAPTDLARVRAQITQESGVVPDEIKDYEVVVFEDMT